MLSLSSQNENKHREFKLPPFCRAVVSIVNLIGTSPSRVETIRAWLKPAHSFCRGVDATSFHLFRYRTDVKIQTGYKPVKSSIIRPKLLTTWSGFLFFSLERESKETSVKQDKCITN